MPSVKNANNNGLNGLNPLSYMGVNPSTPPEMLIKKGAPTANDLGGIQLGTLWLNVSSLYTSPPTPPTQTDIYMLVSKSNTGSGPVATWVQFGSSLTSIQGDTGGIQTGPVVTFTGGSTGLTFNGASNVETLEFAGITANDGDVNLGTDNAANGINIGLGVVGRDIHIGDSAAPHIVSLGSTTGIASTTISGGTGGIEIQGVGIPNVFPGVKIDSNDSDIILNAGTGDTRISGDSSDSNILIGTGSSAKIITVGNSNANSSLTLASDDGLMTMMGVANNIVSNKNYVTIDTTTGELGSDGTVASTFIVSQTATASASIIFDNTYLTSSYKNYVLIMTNVSPSANSILSMEWSVDNGSTYLATNYTSGGSQTTYGGTVVASGGVTQTYLALNVGTMAAAGTRYTGQVQLYNIGSTTIAPSLLGNYMMTDSGAPAIVQGSYSGRHATLTGVNAIRITVVGGNIATGTFKLYGIVG